MTVLLVAGVCVGAWLGMPWLERRAGEIKREPVTVEIAWPPLTRAASVPSKADGLVRGTWLSERYRERIMALVSAAITDDPFDHAALERAAGVLVETGWVSRVRSIRREAGGVVRVDPEWRTPAAVVRHGGVDHLVSTEGELLPVEFEEGGSGMRVILNPSCPPPGKPGERWLGGDVQAALTLMAHVQGHPGWAQVVGIDAERYAKARRLSLVTDRGTRVVWGSPPGETRVGEPTTKQKLANLDRLMNDPAFGRRIDAGMPLVDLSNPRGVVIDASAQPVVPAGMSLPGGGGEEAGADAEADADAGSADALATAGGERPR